MGMVSRVTGMTECSVLELLHYVSCSILQIYILSVRNHVNVTAIIYRYKVKRHIYSSFLLCMGSTGNAKGQLSEQRKRTVFGFRARTKSTTDISQRNHLTLGSNTFFLFSWLEKSHITIFFLGHRNRIGIRIITS